MKNGQSILVFVVLFGVCLGLSIQAQGPADVLERFDGGDHPVGLDDLLGVSSDRIVAAGDPSSGSVSEIVVSPAFASDSTLLAAMSDGLYKSTDAGDTWTLIHNTPIHDPTFSPNYATDHTILALSTDTSGFWAQVLKSTDGGLSWSQVPLPYQMPVAIDLGVSPRYASDRTIFVTFSGSGNLIKLIDGTPSGTALPVDQDLGIAAGDVFGQVAVSPNYETDRTVFVGIFQGSHNVMRSTDAGGSWEYCDTGFPTHDWLYTVFPAVSPVFATDHMLLAAADAHSGATNATDPGTGGVWQSADSGSSWTQLLSGDFRTVAFSPRFSSDDTAYALSSGNNLYVTPNRGGDWYLAGGGIQSFAIAPDGTRVFAGTATGVISWPNVAMQATVDPVTGGGLSSSRGGVIRVTFGSGDVTDPTTLVYLAQPPQADDSGLQLVPDRRFRIDAAPSLLAAGQSYTVIIEYTESQIAGFSEPALCLYRWTPRGWSSEGMSSRVYASLNTVDSQVEGFGTFALGIKPPTIWGEWLEHYTYANEVQDLALYGNELWAATGGGLVRWNTDDGTYSKYTTVEGLASDSVSAVAVDPANGHLWYGGYGAGEYNGSQWTTYSFRDGLASDRVQAIGVDASGVTWFGTQSGVSGFSHNDGWTTYDTVDGLPLDALSVGIDHGDDKWFGTNTYYYRNGEYRAVGVARFDGTTWTVYSSTHGLAWGAVRDLAIEGDGDMWAGVAASWSGDGVEGGGVSRFDGATWTTYTSTHGLISDSVLAVGVDASDGKWFGTTLGVSYYDDVAWTSYSSTHGLAADTVNAVATDGVGNKWFGTADGISRLDPSNTVWTTWRTFDKLPDNYIGDIAVDHDGAKWVGTGRGVVVISDTTWTTYTTADGLVRDDVSAVGIEGDGTKWFGTWGGVSSFDGATWTSYSTTHGLASDYVNAIAVDQDGTKWFGTVAGVSAFDGVTWTTYTTTHGLASDYVRDIAIDHDGNKWFGTSNGLSRFDGTNWTTFTTADGLPSNGVQSVAIGLDDHVWVAAYHYSSGSYVGGVSRFDGTHWVGYGPEDGLPSRWASSLFVDALGNVWCGGAGLSVFDGATWHVSTLVDRVGVAGVHEIVIDPDWHVWLGGSQGLSEFRSAYAPVIQQVLPSGSELCGVGDGVCLEFAPGDLTSAAVVTYTPQARIDVDGFADIGQFFEVSGPTLVAATEVVPASDIPYTITVRYQDAELGSIAEADLALCQYEPVVGQWTCVEGSQVDPDANEVVARVTTFGRWAVLAEVQNVYLPLVLRNR